MIYEYYCILKDPTANTIDLSEQLEGAVESVKNQTEAFAGCLMSGVPTVTCSLEVLLLLMVALLLIQEGFQGPNSIERICVENYFHRCPPAQ